MSTLQRHFCWQCVVIIGFMFWVLDFTSAADSAEIRVTPAADSKSLTLEIEAPDGEVRWTDVVRGLAMGMGLDETALHGFGPPGTIHLNRITAWGALALINSRVGREFEFMARRPAAEGESWWLVIKIDRRAIQLSQRRLKQRLRQAILTRNAGDEREYAIVCDKDWDKTPVDAPLVLFLHGFNSTPEKLQELIEPVRSAKLPCAVLAYPNDQAIAASAKLLSQELRKLATTVPNRQVAIVAHSMGGLVARACIENPNLDPGNVKQLIMVCTPNAGSQLARAAFCTDVFANCFAMAAPDKDAENRSFRAMFYDCVEDGLSEASDDLEPGSLALAEMNARGRNPKVRYTLILGTRSPLSADDLTRMRAAAAKAGQKNRFMQLLGPKLDAWLADLDEIVDGRGDGVVAVKRGRLNGVDDTLELPIDHLMSDPNCEAVRRLQQEIVQRLSAKNP